MTLSNSEKFCVCPLAFQPFDFNRTWWRLFQKRTKIYVFIFFIVCPSSIYGISLHYRYLRFHTSSSILLGQADVHEISFKNVNIYFNCSQWQTFKGYLTLATWSLFDLLAIVFYVFFLFTAFNYPFGFSKRFCNFLGFFTKDDEIDESPCIGHYQCIRVIWQGLVVGRWFSPGTSVSSTNETDRHDITDIWLKVALKTITLTPCKQKCIAWSARCPWHLVLKR